MPDIDRLRVQASSFIDASDIDGLREFTKAHHLEIERDADLAWRVGWAFVQLGASTESFYALDIAMRLRGDAGCYFALAVAKMRKSEELRSEAESLYREAESLYREALSRKDSWTIRLSLAVLLLKEDRAGEGEEILREGILLLGPTAERYREYADYLEDMGRLEEAQGVRNKHLR